MSLVNKIANDRNIPTVDYQHAVLSDYYIIYNHNEGSSSLYKEHLSDYFFHGENIDLKDIKIIINAE